jgi:hypothetical protein
MIESVPDVFRESMLQRHKKVPRPGAPGKPCGLTGRCLDG